MTFRYNFSFFFFLIQLFLENIYVFVNFINSQEL